MLEDTNSHFSSKQKLPLSTGTHWECFQPVHAVTWTRCPAGRFKPKAMALENARSCPYSSHLHGLWMKCSGSGIPGERGPRASHTPCNFLHPQVSALSMSRSILMPVFPASFSSSSSSLPSPPQPRRLPHHSHPLSGRKLKPSGFSITQKPQGRGGCTSEPPIQQINLAPGKEHPARHPRTSPRSLLEPTSQDRMENPKRWGCVRAQLGEQGLLIPDITWPTHEYLLVLHKRNPACTHLSRGKAVGFALETQDKACGDGAMPDLQSDSRAVLLPQHLDSCDKIHPSALTQGKPPNIPLKWVERGMIHSCFSPGKPGVVGVWLLSIPHQDSPAPTSLEGCNLHFCPPNPGRNPQTSFPPCPEKPLLPLNQPVHPVPLQHKEVQAGIPTAERYPLSPPHPPCAPSTLSWPLATV